MSFPLRVDILGMKINFIINFKSFVIKSIYSTYKQITHQTLTIETI